MRDSRKNRFKRVIWQNVALRQQGINLNTLFQMAKQLPSDFEIIAFNNNLATDTTEFLVFSKTFPPVELGAELPELELTFAR